VTATVFVIRAMSRNPELSVVPDRSEKDKGDAIQEEEEDEDDEDHNDGEEEDDDDEEGDDDDEEDEEQNEEVNDDDIGEAAAAAVAGAVPVQSLPAYTPIKQKGDKSDSKASSAPSAHTPSSSSSSSVSKGRDSAGRSAVKGKGKSTIDNEHTIEGVEEVEGEAVDGCRWVMQRLKGLGSDPRGRKRLHVIRVSTYIRMCQSHVILFRHHLLSF
jgi:hypothetical protein